MTDDTGHYRCYEEKRFRPTTLALIGQMNAIIAEYEPRGFSMTVRQLYYQMVQRGLLANEAANYDRVQATLSQARLAGLVSWTALEDRTRNLRGVQHWESPRDAAREAALEYKSDLWRDQLIRPEVWIEKDALVGVIGSICATLRVDFFACRGYNSQSEQWRAGQRFAQYVRRGQRPVVLHLGDHDPSGLDMTRDNRDRLSMFAGVPIMVTRLGLNMDQIEELCPPPNPAKSNDPRYEAYKMEYGESSWELDALPPDYMSKIIDQAVHRLRDPEKWDRALALEVEERQTMLEAAEEMA